jgi:acyl-CoA thioester hydrolase
MLDKFKMGGEAAKKDKKSTFVVEMHTNYNQEVRLDEEVEVHLTHLDHDKKRIHYRVSMLHKEKKYLAATNEVLSLYIDLNKRKVTEFDEEKIKIMDALINDSSSKFNSDKLVFTSKLKK